MDWIEDKMLDMPTQNAFPSLICVQASRAWSACNRVFRGAGLPSGLLPPAAHGFRMPWLLKLRLSVASAWEPRLRDPSGVPRSPPGLPPRVREHVG